MAITLRQESATGAVTKGDSLTFSELDNNFIDILQNKIQAIDLNGDSGQTTLGQSLANEKFTIAGGTGISTALTTDSAGEAVLTITNTASDANTTYTIGAATDGPNANFTLTGSDASTDTIQFVAGTGITLNVDSAGAIEIVNTVTDTDLNTTYTVSAVDSGSDAIIRLTGSDASTDDITLAAGSNITITPVGDTITIASTATAPDFAEGVLAGTNIDVTNDSTGQVTVSLEPVVDAVEFKDYKETIYTGGSTTGTITPDVANGNIQSITLSGNITLNALGNPETGQSMTLIVKQPASGGPYTLSSTMSFAGGTKTLSTAANAVDIISIVYDGTTYFASLSTNFS